MSPQGSENEESYDVFVSYAHEAEHIDEQMKVSALVQAIESQYQGDRGTPLRVFHGPEKIVAMADWETGVLPSLLQSRLMLAILSPAYFASPFCRREWQLYVETELARALPGEGIIPIYVAQHPAFEADPVEVDKNVRTWIKDLRRRWCIDWLSFWPQTLVFREEETKRNLAGLPGQIAERLRRVAARDASVSTIPPPGRHFVGRRDEIHMLLGNMIECQKCVLAPVSGIPGIGASTLAFAYAWGHGSRYPGGRFLIRGTNLGDLAAGLIDLAEAKGVRLGDQDRKSPHRALARVKAAFEQGPPALLLIDEVDDALLFSEQARDRVLPRGDHIHVLATTYLDPGSLPGLRFQPLDALTSDDAVALLQTFRSFPDHPAGDEATAALDLVRRLSGHALAIELAGVCLREFSDLSIGELLSRLEHDGLPVLDDLNSPARSEDRGHRVERIIAWLLEPILASLTSLELRAVEYAAFLPSDLLPLPWLRDLLLADFPAAKGSEEIPQADDSGQSEATRSVGRGAAKVSLVDPFASEFDHLQWLRLIQPARENRSAELSGKPTLARIHRLVPGAIQARLKDEVRAMRLQRINNYAQVRGESFENQSPVKDREWELLCLRDMAIRQIKQEDRRGLLLADRIADPLIRTGRMADVQELWRLSITLFRKRSQAQPENPEHAFLLARSLQRLGNLAQTTEDLVGARRYHSECLKILTRLAASFPGSAEFAQFLSMSHTDLGDLERTEGKLDEAKRHYEFSLQIARRQVDLAPANLDRAADLVRCLDRLGDLAAATETPDEARRYSEESESLKRHLAENSGAT